MHYLNGTNLYGQCPTKITKMKREHNDELLWSFSSMIFWPVCGFCSAVQTMFSRHIHISTGPKWAGFSFKILFFEFSNHERYFEWASFLIFFFNFSFQWCCLGLKILYVSSIQLLYFNRKFFLVRMIRRNTLKIKRTTFLITWLEVEKVELR